MRQPARKKRRRSDIIALAFDVVAVICVIGGFALILHSDDRIDSQQHALRVEAVRIGSQHTQLVEACKRLQILRVQDNVSHYADFLVFRVVYQESVALQHVRPQGTPLQRHFQRRFLRELLAAIREKTWTPRTDCSRAVSEHGARYKPPHPVPFVQALPPRSALRLVRGDLSG